MSQEDTTWLAEVSLGLLLGRYRSLRRLESNIIAPNIHAPPFYPLGYVGMLEFP